MCLTLRDAGKSWEARNPQQKKTVGMNGVDMKVWMPLYTCLGVVVLMYN